MIPVDALTLIATLGLSQEQAKAVAEGFRLVEDATKDECGRAMQERRKADAERQARFRERRNVTSRDITLENVSHVTPEPSRTRAFSVGEEVNNIPHPNATHSSAPKGAERAKRLSDDWIPKDYHRQRAIDLGVSRERFAEIVEEFRNYWMAEGGPKARKLNWDLVFTNRLIDQAKRGQNPRGPPSNAFGTRNGKQSIYEAARARDERINGDHGNDRRESADEIRPLLGRQLPGW